MGKKRLYPTPPVPLGDHALRRYRAILERVDTWSAVNIDRAAHLAVLEAKAASGRLYRDEREHMDYQRRALGLA